MSKVTVIGAGMVGATCANVLATRNVADQIVLIDIKEGLSEGKMLDMYQASATTDSKSKLIGCTNANIVKSVVSQALAHSPRAIFIIVSNPMDTMAYLTLKSTGLPKNRVIGMGGALDSSRFRCYLAKAANSNSHDIEGMVIGGHGDTTMIPLISKASIKGVPASQFLSKKKLQQVAADTMVGGATLTGLLGTSAWCAPGAAAASMVEAILGDQKRMIPCGCYLEGEYGQEDIMIGVPAIIGRKGIEKIVKIELTKDEQAQFEASAAAVRKVNQILYDTKAI